MSHKKLAFLFLLPSILSVVSYAQHIHVGQVFPTIADSGSLTKKNEDSLHYFGVFPLVAFEHSSETTPCFNLFYSEQALTYKTSENLSITESNVYQRAHATARTLVHEKIDK
jgi:hypothetical protein